MSAMRKTRLTSLPAPYLKRLWVREDGALSEQYPFNLPWLDKDFALDFATPVTIIVGENGTGKSTLIEAVAALCGFDEAGGGKGYMALLRMTASRAAKLNNPIRRGNRNSAPPRPINPPSAPIIPPPAKATGRFRDLGGEAGKPSDIDIVR